jgi:uncharacterized RDD family membrane protein YckC
MSTRTLEGHYAGFLSRAVSLILDTWLVSGLATAQVYLIGQGAALFGANPTTCRNIAGLPPGGEIACVVGALSLIFAVLMTAPIYYTLCWALVGQTVGQRVIGLRVCKLDGGDLGLRRSFLRYIGYVLCVVTLGIGFLWVLIDDRRLGWHDKLARTCVIYDWKAEQNEGFIARVRGKFGRNRRKTPPAPQTGS